jgi:hypothetical protein
VNRQNEGVLKALPVLACETCGQLRDWGAASGPDDIAQRIVVMLDLAAGGGFEEVHPRYVDGDYKDCVLWSSVDPGSIRSLFPDGPAPSRGLPDVVPLIALRCGSCDRDFVQRWVWERGRDLDRYLEALSP